MFEDWTGWLLVEVVVFVFTARGRLGLFLLAHHLYTSTSKLHSVQKSVKTLSRYCYLDDVFWDFLTKLRKKAYMTQGID